jgi:3'-phosphoadenosine 5'-phosphosulfate sulfotransferase (PAPS reductase)/FAD synthetase
MQPHVQEARTFIGDELAHSPRPVVLASGGKDSLALLHLMREYAERVVALHVKMDDGWPGQTEHLEARCKEWGFKLHLLKPLLPFSSYVKTFGWPMTLMPTRSQGQLVTSPDFGYRDGPRISPWTHCHESRMARPLLAFVSLYKPSSIFTGTRAQDDRLFDEMGARPAYPETVQRVNPLHHWSREQVYAYLDEEWVSLTPHDRLRQASGEGDKWSDCMSCTRHPEHWRLMQRYYPEAFKERWPAAKEAFDAAQDEAQAVARAVGDLKHAIDK